MTGAERININNHVYQIDCQTTKKGKIFCTKRRICWKFGFPNRDAIDKGLSGNECRGEEHEVVFVWSLTSGKKFVLADGHEVHWSKNKSPFSSDKFECKWEMTGGHILTVVAYSSCPLLFEKKRYNNSNSSNKDVGSNNNRNSFRQFDLSIDGISFSKMQKMFQLGLTKNVKNQRMMRSSAPPMSMIVNRDSCHFAPIEIFSHERKHSDDDLVTVTNSLHSSQSLLLLDDQYYPQQKQQFPSCMSQSQSMPDLLLLNLSSSPTSVMTMTGRATTTTTHLPPLVPAHNQISPTSVMMASTTTTTTMNKNPFDIYSTQPSKVNLCHHQQMYQQTDVSTGGNTIARQYSFAPSSFDYSQQQGGISPPNSSNNQYNAAPTQQHSIVY